MARTLHFRARMKKLSLLGSLVLLAVACGGAEKDANAPSATTTSTSTATTTTAAPTDTTNGGTSGSTSTAKTGGDQTSQATAGGPALPPKPLQPVPAPGPTHTGDPAPKSPPSK